MIQKNKQKQEIQIKAFRLTLVLKSCHSLLEELTKIVCKGKQALTSPVSGAPTSLSQVMPNCLEEERNRT